MNLQVQQYCNVKYIQGYRHAWTRFWFRRKLIEVSEDIEGGAQKLESRHKGPAKFD